MKNKRIMLLRYSKENNLDFNISLKYYIFDSILYRLSLSMWNKYLILKGGFLLSLLTNVKERVTKDIDFSVNGRQLDIEMIRKVITDISKIEVNDDVYFSLSNIDIIMEDKNYYGVRVYLDCVAFGIIDSIHIDFATGDKIYPPVSIFKHESILKDYSFNIYTYNLESILSEKLETILSKLENNSRMKDYFDIYFISRYYYDSINVNNLKKAIKNTFQHRGYHGNPFEAYLVIKNSNTLRSYWESYSKKNYIDITFDEVTKELEQYINYIKPYMKRASFELSFV